jgi:ribosomal protein S18 acetylase RimI-like enzyme
LARTENPTSVGSLVGLTDVSVRPATAEDVDFLVQVNFEPRISAEPEASDDGDADWLRGARGWTCDQVLGRVENSTTYVIVRGTQRVGRLRLVRTPGRIELAGIQVHSSYRNAGVGTSVIEAVLREAAAAGAVTQLRVSKDNPAAERLYTRLGFRRGRLEGDDYEMSAEPGDR